MNNMMVQILSGFLGSFAFAFLYNIRGKKLLFAGLGSLIAVGSYVLLAELIESTAICYFIVAAVISVYAEIMARVLKSPTTTFIPLALIPLVPGSALYYTMAYVFDSDWNSFLEKAIYTMSLTVALALGIVLISAITKMIHKEKTWKSELKIKSN